METEQSNLISNTVFGFTLTVVIVSLIGLFFPVFMVSLFHDLSIPVYPFEFGVWAIPVLIVNLTLLAFGIMYYKKILPSVIYNLINFFLNFEVSRKVAILIVVILIGIYVIFSVEELTIFEGDEWVDFSRIQKALEEFPFNKYRGNVSIVYVQNFFLWISDNVLGNIKILPFLASISLILLTYLFTVQITQKRFAGLVAMVILMQSYTFLRYDTSATYSNFWTLFYLLSLYLIYKRSYLSPVSYILSVFSKPISALFLPLTLFFIYNAEIPNKKKIRLTVPYLVILGLIIAAILLGVKLAHSFSPFDYATFWQGFAVLALELRFDGLVLVFLLPLVVMLFLKSRKGFKQADSILILMSGILISEPLLVALTYHNIQPYRYIPFIVFFAIGVGMLFSKKLTQSP